MPARDMMSTRAEVFGSVFVITQHLTRRTDRALEPLGLSTRQWLLLGILTKEFPDRSPSLSEAAERYGSSRQNVKQIAIGLERLGYLHLVADPGDGRVTRLQRTDAVRVFDEPAMQSAGADLVSDAFAGLTDADVRSLGEIVRRWLVGLSDPGTSRDQP